MLYCYAYTTEKPQSPKVVNKLYSTGSGVGFILLLTLYYHVLSEIMILIEQYKLLQNLLCRITHNQKFCPFSSFSVSSKRLGYVRGQCQHK